jgi:uncharacterized damage-inducible protein DinB
MMYLSLIDRLKTQHKAIPAIISTVDDERLNYHPEPGKWSIHDNVAHLATYQPMFIERMHKILTTDNPNFNRYRADDEAEFLAWQPKPIPLLTEKIEGSRKILIQLLTGLTDVQLERRGQHPKYGNLNIKEWTEFFLLHEAHHLFTIFQLVHSSPL